MKEAPQTHEQIPPHWNLPERNEEGLKIVQKDEQEGFLAFTLPEKPNLDDHSNKGHSIEYFFNPDGNPVGSRRDKTNHLSNYSYVNEFSFIKIKNNDIETDYVVKQCKDDIVCFSGAFKSQNGFSFATPDGYFFTPDGLASFLYGYNGHLGVAALGKSFIERKNDEGGNIESPVASLYCDPRKSGDLPEDWEFSSTYSYIILNKKLIPIGSSTINTQWNLKEKVLTLSQEHLPTGIIKTLRLPTRIHNNDSISALVSTKPPYPKDQRGKLVVPWISIGGIVGPSLSYSYPPQTPQK